MPTPVPVPRASLAALLLLLASCDAGGRETELPVMSGHRTLADLLAVPDAAEVLAERPDDPVRLEARASDFAAESRRLLRMAPPAEVRFELPARDALAAHEPELAFQFGLHFEQAAEAGGRVVFEVELEGQPVFASTLSVSDGARTGDRELLRGRMPLDGGRALLLRTRFEGSGTPPTAGFDVLEIVSERTTRRTRASRERPNLLVFAVEGLGASRAPGAADAPGLGPRLAELAAAGVLFEHATHDARFAAPLSWLSLSPAAALPAALPEALSAQGVTTAGFSTRPLGPDTPRFASEFEIRWEGGPGRPDRIVDEIGAALGRYGEYRFFFHVHVAEERAGEADAWIGAVLRRLTELGLGETRLVAVLGLAPDRPGDGAPGAASVPLILAGPGLPSGLAPGARVATPVPATSFAPTLLALMRAGAPAEPDLFALAGAERR